MDIQLWSYNYEPEPSGIAPLSATVARSLAERNEVTVVAAHPHYPEPRWGKRLRPYRERRDGIPVLRLPIFPGRGSALRRIWQELSFVAPLSASVPLLPPADVLMAVSPSFPALAPAMAYSRLRGTPWVLWLQDILPDGATVSGVMREGFLIERARDFERAAYRSASRIVVLSDSFRDHVVGKGVPAGKVTRVYNPASKPVRSQPRPHEGIDPRSVLNMGNIGHTQNLAAITRAFEDNAELAKLGATFTMAGDGVAGEDVRMEIRSDRVTVTGMLDQDALEPFLRAAAVGLVSQSYDGVEFNVPSKLMNFMAYGIPVVAAVRPGSEVARLVEASGAGWVTGSPEECAHTLARVLPDAEERERRGLNALRFAQREFEPRIVAQRIEEVLRQASIPTASG